MKSFLKAIVCTFSITMGALVIAGTETGEFLRLVGVWLIAIPVQIMGMKLFEDREKVE